MDPGDMQMSFKMASDMHMSQSTVSKVHDLCTAVNNFNWLQKSVMGKSEYTLFQDG